ADSLTLPARQKTIDRTDAGNQAFGDMFPVKWIRRRRVQRIRFHGFHGRTAVHGLSESVEHAAQQTWSDGEPSIRHTRDHAAAELQPLRLFQRHREHAPVTKSDYLRADAVAFRCKHFAKVADGHGGALRFY